MIGTSARPFSVSWYSTRGGTSGNVWRATMPSSSSALSLSESVRGEMPSRERSSSQKRQRPSARSRITSSVHLPQTISAVLTTGQSGFGMLKAQDSALLQGMKLARGSEDDRHFPLFGASHHREYELCGGGFEGVEQVVDAAQRGAVRRRQEVAALDAGRVGGAAV